MNGQLSWQGYGIESIITFLKDSQEVINNEKTPIDFEEIRPTFKEALISTATIDAASKVLKITIFDKGKALNCTIILTY